MLPEPDRERLVQIKDAAYSIADFTAGLSEETFRDRKLVQHAVTNCLHIIIEAASRVSDETRQQHPEIEWDVIRGMRNRLAHAYFDINLGIVWQSTTVDVPRLLESVHRILEDEGP